MDTGLHLNATQFMILRRAWNELCSKSKRLVMCVRTNKTYVPVGLYYCQICHYRNDKYYAVTVDPASKVDNDKSSVNATLFSESMFHQHFIFVEPPCETNSN